MHSVVHTVAGAALPLTLPAMETAPAIAVDSLTVKRGGREVLHGVSLVVQPRCVTGLLGPSGCGKTTLMRAIVGVQVVESGQVVVLGRPAGSPALRRSVGYVTQAPSIYLDLSVRENLRYFARTLNADQGLIDRAIRTVGLQEHAKHVVGSLSGGEQARASLATALLGEPKVLVLDEPTVGLDPVLRRELWATFSQLARGGATLLISSHVMDEAEHCDRLVLMREGEVLADDTPDGLRARTGERGLDAAFLSLVEQSDRVQ